MGKDYTVLSKDIVKYVGTEKNIISVFHCATRLRFKVKKNEEVNLDKLKSLEGVITAMNSGGQIQVVIGNQVDNVYQAVLKNSDIKKDQKESEDQGGEKKNIINVLMETISGIFAPALGILAGAGTIKALLLLLTTLNVLTETSGTYQIWYAAADGIFTFLPILLGYTAGKKFGCSQFTSIALVYPNMTALYSAEKSISFLGINVHLISYASSVMPIIISTYIMSKLEKLLKKYIPEILKMFAVPMIELMIMVPATFLIIGPVMDKFGSLLAAGYSAIVGFNPILAGGILGLIWPAAVIFGLHWGFFPIVMNNLATMGKDTLFVITGPNNFAQAGATLGVFLKTKDKKLKSISGSAAISAVLAGITEPAIYGVTLPYKKPFFIGAVFSGIAGAITAAVGASAPTVLGMSILSMPGYLGTGFVGLVIACVIAYFGSAICTYLFGFSDDMIVRDEQKADEPEKLETDDEILGAPVNGNMISLKDVKDEVFASGVLGEGFAMEPSDGEVKSPCNGTITAVAETGHAIGIVSDHGAEVLIHIGMDTVKMNGKGFKVHVKVGQKVKAKQPLVTVDLAKVKEAGYDTVTPMVITNGYAYHEIVMEQTGIKNVGDAAISLISK